MRRICLSVTGILLSLFASFAQTPSKDSSSYKSRKLSFEEANLVSSYYRQDGDNAAVTGGIGSEKLTDLSNSIDVRFIKWDKRSRKHSFDIEVGVDHYTSASSDQINPQTISSASHADTRIYPSLNWSVEDEKKGTTFGAGLSFSTEFDYQSAGLGLNFSKKTANRNGEFTAKGQVYLDRLKYILPVELRPGGGGGGNGDDEGEHYPTKNRNSYSGSLSYSQIINQRLQVMFIADLVYQQGYLGLPFHRVYFLDNSVNIEKLPDQRIKIPLGFRASYFLGDRVILRGFYRYYTDDWGVKAHTVNLETPIKINPFLSVSPFYRYYTQTAADYFMPYRNHKLTDEFYTSNYDLSKFNSNFYGAGFKITPPKGVFGIQRLNTLELRYGHYTRTTGMNSDIVSLHLKFK
ncbi:MAG TPA: DUF3570 domain-containing protein [Chitinophagaceae bacterium]|nr:DUF3570 domain-containing protein [Chitinophagaceae bacterium]MCB9056670.1 DUF3570 domain-containing protein [Chitinophagales bacterium]HPG11158.1 DUF3570 domain-containing protein [Chitinophagaceae bacterium]